MAIDKSFRKFIDVLCSDLYGVFTAELAEIAESIFYSFADERPANEKLH
jgi:hypothetical protein